MHCTLGWRDVQSTEMSLETKPNLIIEVILKLYPDFSPATIIILWHSPKKASK